MTDKLVPEGRRLDKGLMRPPSKYLNGPAQAGQRLAELEKARQKMGLAIDSYAKLLVDSTLPQNRLSQDKDRQKNTLDSLPKLAAELDTRNLNEGTQTLVATLLNSIFVLRDQINTLKWQVYHLNQTKLDKSKQEVPSPPAETTVSEASINGDSGNQQS